MAKLAVKNLTIRFGEFVAVNNLSFEVKEGEIVGLLGPNGAGKTTTIRAIFGVIPYEGSIEFGGRQIDVSDRRKIGWMPQNSPLYLNLTVEENLRFFASIYGVERSKVEERVNELLKLVELEKFRKRLVKNLSGGMKQRLMLACSMVHDPELLVLDEPTAGVDPPLRRTFWEHFSRLNEEGKTILVTTHYMDEAENCQRLILMRNGTKIVEGKPDEIKRAALGGEVIELRTSNDVKSAKILEDMGYRVELNGVLHVIVDDAAISVPAVIEELKREGIAVFRAETKKLTLEDAFMRLIGG
ncbi:ABC transporter ATP-binding protein [Archaeoglobus veneficus]|uniref:Sulfate-transporting ATPase n=1 Tax=Archaeoglobus veneficus (strain DSM 11195 / SNP6) TaxID=693661 RepID=F2KPW0_ARCVS|nr:ABC transporter ATP-binding protein [Archaeoglobus veneficus]AEA46467.1 Sulfate-transporting ATPase [Archaeoglobus veneficus SNP6]